MTLTGQNATAVETKAALEKRLGHKVHKTMVYRLLKRQGWRKLVPRPFHVDAIRGHPCQARNPGRLSVSQIVNRVREEVPERKAVEEEAVRREVETALLVGAALPEEMPGSLRLRVHRFIRGGWRFHRCVNPDCGRLYPMGEEKCTCSYATAPLYLCRNCGADFLRFVAENPLEEPLRPSAVAAEGPEWVLYEPGRFETVLEDEIEEEGNGEPPPGSQPGRRGGRKLPTQMKKRPVLHGSFDPWGLTFSDKEEDYPVRVVLAPARTRCLCCGGLR